MINQPAKENHNAYPDGHFESDGVTVRQYYKAAAVSGMIVAHQNDNMAPSDIARFAAMVADAMIAEDQAHEENDNG